VILSNPQTIYSQDVTPLSSVALITGAFLILTISFVLLLRRRPSIDIKYERPIRGRSTAWTFAQSRVVFLMIQTMAFHIIRE